VVFTLVRGHQTQGTFPSKKRAAK